MLSFAIAISGWTIPVQEVHAATKVTNMSGGYLYIPTSIGCPSIPSDGRFSINNNAGWSSIDADYIFINPSSGVISGNNIRYTVTGGKACRFYSYDGHTEWSDIPMSSLQYYVNNYGIYVNSAGSHSFSTKVSNATCTSAAVYKCSRCGVQTSSGSALGHAKGATATCTTKQTCTRCGTTLVNALGHDWHTATLEDNNSAMIEPTVYEDGTYYQVCSRCGTGDLADPYTNHYNVVPGSKKNWNIYVGTNQVQEIWIGDTKIYDMYVGDISLVV